MKKLLLVVGVLTILVLGSAVVSADPYVVPPNNTNVSVSGSVLS